MKRILALLLTSVCSQTFTSFITPSVEATKTPLAADGFRCMHAGSSPPYPWTSFDVRAVGGALTVTVDDGNTGNPALRTWCWNMNIENDVTVDIYYQTLGARELHQSEAREAQAIGTWLNPHMVRSPIKGSPTTTISAR